MMLLCSLAFPAHATEIAAPTAPEAAHPYMPEENESFADGLWFIVKQAISAFEPELASASGICLSVTSAALLLSILNSFAQEYEHKIQAVGAVIIGVLLLEPVNSMIQLGATTVEQLSDYAKLLIPVMTAAVASQGGLTSAAALYTGTVFFNTLLATIIAKLVVPALYIYLCLCIAECAVGQELLKKIRDFVKWLMTWCLKLVLYAFTGYISITGVISGTVDASALKAAKLTISGMVPVVGGILSDATETILVSAGTLKNAAGIYGIFAVLAICVSPFVKIGAQYLLLKLSGAFCHTFGSKTTMTLIQNFTTGMGFALAMTGTVCILLLISLVCFMKGMS